jgi:predicted DNA-binding transcriptional regulator AlpA
MHNPFETLSSRLSNLEQLTLQGLEILSQLSNGQPHTSQTGGKELAHEITGLSYARIYALVSQRAIPHSKRGNRLFFNRADLLAWVAEGSRGVSKK